MTQTSKESQKLSILNDLMIGVSPTGLDAIKWYGCIKLSNRISELIQEGFDIKSKWLHIKTKFGEKKVKQYYLEPTPEAKSLYRKLATS